MALHRVSHVRSKGIMPPCFFVLLLLCTLAGRGMHSHARAFEMTKRRNVLSTSKLERHAQRSITSRQAPEVAHIDTALMLSGGHTEKNAKKTIWRKPLFHEMFAEFIGTFILVQIGCGTVCSAIYLSAQAGLWQIAVVWSIAVTLAISATASVSGAHLNPAITIALALLRSDAFKWCKVLPYIMAQLAGAVLAAGVNLALFSDAIVKFETAKDIVRGTAASTASAAAFGEYFTGTSVPVACLAEVVGTAILAFIVFALTNPKNETTQKHPMMIPPLIGATVGALISVIAPLTQACFNPARDFGPRIVTLLAGWGKTVAMKGWWLYVLCPIAGAPIGGFIADKLLYAEKAESET